MSEERTEQEKEFGKEKEKKTKWRGGGGVVVLLFSQMLGCFQSKRIWDSGRGEGFAGLE